LAQAVDDAVLKVVLDIEQRVPVKRDMVGAVVGEWGKGNNFISAILVATGRWVVHRRTSARFDHGDSRRGRSRWVSAGT
jgi:hypothetical protein